MLNKRKLTVLIALAVAAIVGVIVGFAAAGPHLSAAPASEPEPSPSASSTGVDAAAVLTPELLRTVYAGATIAARFVGSDAETQKRLTYRENGFSEELAATFTPVWFDVFADPIVGTAETLNGQKLISAVVNVQAREVTLESVEGDAGARVFRMAVRIDCVPQWTTQNGQLRMPAHFTAFWHVTLDEASGKITDVAQPTLDEIPLRPKA